MQTRKARAKFRAYLTPEQASFLRGALGACRVVYNDHIYQKELAREEGRTSSTARDLSAMKTLPETHLWLRDYGSKILQQSKRDAETAYKNFFNSINGKRRGKKVGKPRYKKKKHGGSIRWNGVSLKTRKVNHKWSEVFLPGHKTWIKFRQTIPMDKVSGVTLILEPSGKHYVSFVYDQEIHEAKKDGSVVGIDLGLTDFASIVSTSGVRNKVSAPRFLRNVEKKIRRKQRAYSRKEKGSKNQEKSRISLSREYEKVRFKRQDFYRSLALKLASENQAVVLESLNVSGLMKNRRVSKSFSDAGLSSFVNTVKSTCERLGVSLDSVDRFAPTSQVCCVCGVLDGPKPLSVRVWDCQHCGTVLDRDYNAAVNILLAAGHAERLNDCGFNVRLLGAVEVEAVTSVSS